MNGPALLRNRKAAIAHDQRLVLVPVIDRYRDLDIVKLSCGDATVATSEMCKSLEADQNIS